MSKEQEIDYINQLAKVLNVSPDEVEDYHLRKPFSDIICGSYLIDIGQIMSLLPKPPARILDLGVGSGWTSEIFARKGYNVLGLDIAPDMIKIAKKRTNSNLKLQFEVHDYENSLDFGLFDAVVIYDALHHAIDEASVIFNAFHALKPNGVFITLEPGRGHSMTPESIEAMKKFGTTEKDMEYSHQAKLMSEAGFGSIRQYLRLTQLPLQDTATRVGLLKQSEYFEGLSYATANGLTSLVVAVKDTQDSAHQLEPIMLSTDGITLSELRERGEIVREIQEEFSRVQLQLQQTQQELVNYQLQCQQTQEELANSQLQLQQTQEELVNSQLQLQQTQEELVNSQLQLQQTQEKLVNSQLQCQQTQEELVRSQAMIEAMKTSKFWKMRTQWFKLKKLVGLKTDD
jgi:2-polyprenyl-3-methyl-5-hydroxy-6-metoxy-1,4-benzoquinol methylase